MALSEILAHIDPSELVALTRDLVRSVIKPGDPSMTEAAVAAFIQGWFEKEGFATEVQDVVPGRPNVIAWLGERGTRTLLLEGHTDVVTEGDRAAWTHAPFAAEVVDGRIYGRGTADMKGGPAAAMIAAAALKRSGLRLGGRLVVGALVDEEGDMLGAKHLCATPLGGELSAAIICEPEENEICLEQRGVVWVKATSQVTGRRARFGGVPGSTDGTILRTQLGIPIVTCGPGNRLVPHQVNEYIDIEELVTAARIYVASALNFLEVE